MPSGLSPLPWRTSSRSWAWARFRRVTTWSSSFLYCRTTPAVSAHILPPASGSGAPLKTERLKQVSAPRVSSFGAGAGKESAYADAVPNGSVDEGEDAPDIVYEISAERTVGPRAALEGPRSWMPLTAETGPPHVIVRLTFWPGWAGWVRARAPCATPRKLRRQGRDSPRHPCPDFRFKTRVLRPSLSSPSTLLTAALCACSPDGTASEYSPPFSHVLSTRSPPPLQQRA